MEELRKKYKVTIAGPNTICALIQSYHLGFQTLKVQKHATEIYDHLKTISTRFSKHFDNVLVLRKKLVLKLISEVNKKTSHISSF